MAIAFYMDHQVPQAITDGLRLRQVDVLTAYGDGANRLSDPELLDRATALGRVLFSQDKDLLREAESRQQSGSSFGGVVFARRLAPVRTGGAVTPRWRRAQARGHSATRSSTPGRSCCWGGHATPTSVGCSGP